MTNAVHEYFILVVNVRHSSCNNTPVITYGLGKGLGKGNNTLTGLEIKPKTPCSSAVAIATPRPTVEAV